jgi:CRP-like cAMP-binding protein
MLPIERLIRKLQVDTHLSDEDAAAIRNLPVHIREVTADTPIIREGDRPTQCCLVVNGFACRSKVADSGKRQILSFHIPGEIPDLQSLFLKTMDHDVIAISDATLGFIDHSSLGALIDRQRAVARALWRETLIDAAIFREWIVNMGVRPAAARLAHLMAELHERMAAVGLTQEKEFDFPVTQAELAEALGMTPVHVNRILKQFRTLRVLDLQRNKVKIADYEKVVAAAGFDDAYLHLTKNVSPI